jgi:hypothetical protein
MQGFDNVEHNTTSIAASFAWRPPAIAYRSPGRELSLLKCLASRISWLEGIATPPPPGQDCITLIASPQVSPLHELVCHSRHRHISPCVIARKRAVCEEAPVVEDLLVVRSISGMNRVGPLIGERLSHMAAHEDEELRLST